ncbi:uncharacterized protein LOC129907064 isoform X2 [Episyrphus balteatus]|uniref:uncharacterized protein LOC129907064 isoform X2 n=1 Tax=Episyrphus balteatus TaxID=286459 RepID=UPI002484FF0D|nr:uncharacterized protein LOC129907064 isoform X2 [Episyrphus balteatus]
MDFGTIAWIVFGVFLVLIIIGTCISRSMKKRRPIYQAPVYVTSATHTTPGSCSNEMQTVSVYPASNFSNQQIIHGQQASVSVIGINSQVVASNPLNAQPNYSMNPPSYENTVGANQASYQQQPPYNPSYM